MHLIGLSLTTIALQYYFVYYALFAKNMVTAANTFFKTQSFKNSAQVIKQDACICTALQYF